MVAEFGVVLPSGSSFSGRSRRDQPWLPVQEPAPDSSTQYSQTLLHTLARPCAGRAVMRWTLPLETQSQALGWRYSVPLGVELGAPGWGPELGPRWCLR